MEALSVFRCENKYWISRCSAMSMQEKFNKVLVRDQNSLENSYMVRSLYFDSINNIDYVTKLAGTEERKKIRVRTYSSNARYSKLEVKQKKGDLQHKVSIWIAREDVRELSKCNYSVLTKYFEDSSDAVYIYSLMVRGCYRPVVLIEYDRIAYTFPSFHTRITFDMNVRSSESDLDLFKQKPIYQPLSGDKIILEIKYNERLVKFVSDILRQYDLTRCSISKYCMGRTVFRDFNYS